MSRTRGGDPVGERALADDRGDVAVALGGDQDVATAKRRSPQRDAGGVDSVQRSCVGERRGPVGELAFDVQQLPWVSAAVAEVAVGEDQCGDAGVGEAAGERLQAVLARRAEAVPKDHQRRVVGLGQEQPGAAFVA